MIWRGFGTSCEQLSSRIGLFRFQESRTDRGPTPRRSVNQLGLGTFNLSQRAAYYMYTYSPPKTVDVNQA